MKYISKKQVWKSLKRRSIKDKETKCLEWQGAITNRGYPNIAIEIPGYDSKYWGGHRLAYYCKHGDLSKGDCVCHICDNPKCINPKHLFLGTHKENMEDMADKGRAHRPIGNTFGAGCTHWVGRKHTEETKTKMQLAAQGKHDGKKNSQYGTCWIYNMRLKENKKIPRFELPEWRKEGWLQGRKMKF